MKGQSNKVNQELNRAKLGEDYLSVKVHTPSFPFNGLEDLVQMQSPNQFTSKRFCRSQGISASASLIVTFEPSSEDHSIHQRVVPTSDPLLMVPFCCTTGKFLAKAKIQWLLFDGSISSLSGKGLRKRFH